MGSEARRIEIKKDTEAEHVESTDYYFNRIGKPIPIIKDDTNDSSVAVFQLKNPPSQPLAVSLPHRLIFVAHSSGNYFFPYSSCDDVLMFVYAAHVVMCLCA